mmetsp:Transcript_23585/g.48367  ORF Transcript_23585/g.48367 Transcript_23585/m.48367 type:complete len:81 (-) Transcript_23585:461-703(-)
MANNDDEYQEFFAAQAYPLDPSHPLHFSRVKWQTIMMTLASPLHPPPSSTRLHITQSNKRPSISAIPADSATISAILIGR